MSFILITNYLCDDCKSLVYDFLSLGDGERIGALGGVRRSRVREEYGAFLVQIRKRPEKHPREERPNLTDNHVLQIEFHGQL